MEYINIVLTYRHPLFKLSSDFSILYHLLRQRRFISFYFGLNCFPQFELNVYEKSMKKRSDHLATLETASSI